MNKQEYINKTKVSQMLNINHFVTLEDLSTDDLCRLYREAKVKLQERELSIRDKKVFTLRVFLISSILKERQNIECKGEINNEWKD